MHRLYVAMRDGFEVRTWENGDWSSRTTEPSNTIECVAAAGTRPDQVFCGTFNDGLLRSRDGGASFERVGRTEIEPDAITSIAIETTDPNVILVGTEPSAVYRSSDGGESWVRIEGINDVASADTWSFPPRPETHHVRWISIAPDDPHRWYVGIEAGAFLLTTDGGNTWVDRPEGSRRDNHWFATHPEDPMRIYVAAGDGYAESLDGGNTWIHPQEGLEHRYVWSVAVDSDDPDRRFVSAASGAMRAHRPGSAEAYVYRRFGDEPWERITDLPVGNGVLRPVLGAGLDTPNIYAVSNLGIFESWDGGNEWERVPGDWRERYRNQPPRGVAVVDVT